MSKMMRRKDVLETTGFSASTLWREEKAGNFPQRRQISAGTVGWLAYEVEKWLANRQTVTPSNSKVVAPQSKRGRKPKQII